MRKVITLSNKWESIQGLVGSGVEAWVYGSVAKGQAGENSDIDIYVDGPAASKVEAKYQNERPIVKHDGKQYPAHIIGSGMVSKSDFLKSQPEAIKVS